MQLGVCMQVCVHANSFKLDDGITVSFAVIDNVDGVISVDLQIARIV